MDAELRGVGLEDPWVLAAYPVLAVLLYILLPRAWSWASTRLYGVWHPYHRILGLAAESRRRQSPCWGRLGLALLAASLLALLIAAGGPYLVVAERVEASGSLEAELTVKARPLAVLVIDVSGSMAGEKLAEAKRAAQAFVEEAVSAADVSLIAFSDTIKALTPPTQNKTMLLEAIGGLEAGGGTMYSVALSSALSVAAPYIALRMPVAVVFVTDGMPGDHGSYEPLVERAAGLGVRIHCVYIGPGGGAARTVLEGIAGRTGGKVYLVDDIGELAGVLKSIASEEKQRLTIEAQQRLTVEREKRLSLAPAAAAAGALLSAATVVARQRRCGNTF